jgi:molybdate transport system permease protein
VVGFILLVLFGRRGPIGGWLYDTLGITIIFTWQGAALAAAVVGFPLMVRAMRLSLEAVDRRLEAAARTLGAKPFDVFTTITLPLMAPGILAGAILAFARGLGEFGATITFVSNIPGQTRTIPMAIYTYTQVPEGDLAAFRLSIVSVLLALVALVASELLARRVRARIGG